MNRRKFLGILGGAIAAPAALVKAEPVKALDAVETMFATGNIQGATAYIQGSFADMVTETINKRRYTLVNNIAKNNALLEKLNAREESIL